MIIAIGNIKTVRHLALSIDITNHPRPPASTINMPWNWKEHARKRSNVHGREEGFWATQMLRLSGNYQIIVMYNISMTIKGISVSCVYVSVQLEQVIVFRWHASNPQPRGSARVIIHGRNCTNAIWLCVQSTATLGCPAGLPFDFQWPLLTWPFIASLSLATPYPLPCPALPPPSPLAGGCLLSPLIVDLAFLGSFFQCSRFLCRFLRVVVNYRWLFSLAIPMK